MKTVLMTGAAGDVATHLRRALAGKYQFRLSDIRPVTDLAKTERFRKAQLDRLSDVTRVTKGVDAIIHLGGFSKEGTWEEILQANIIGSYNLFEAARRNGIRRIVFASTNHVTGFHPREAVLDHHADVRPDSRYGASKVFGEALGRLYVDKYGLEVCCIRIGNPTPTPADKRRLSIWTSPRDLAQLVSIGLEHPDIRFEIVYGVSANTRSFYDNSNALRLGYRPQDNSETYAPEVLKHDEPSGNTTEERYQGGAFTTAESFRNPGR